MIGSIIGDIVGSDYEFANIKTKDFPLFTDKKEFTDDSILTIATADWMMHGGKVGDYYLKYALKYPNPMGAYGSNFAQWVNNDGKKPYNSCGNGSAMRVGPVGWLNSSKEVQRTARETAMCTHNHKEGVKGAQAVALCIYLAREGVRKENIRKDIIGLYGYDLNFTCDEIRDSYQWGGTCQTSVPQAIVAFLDGKDFEDSIRNAISIGGDSDTIGCITGSIAEAYYGVPKELYDKAMQYLPFELKAVICDFETRYGNNVI